MEGLPDPPLEAAGGSGPSSPPIAAIIPAGPLPSPSPRLAYLAVSTAPYPLE
eukprot:CAMPEP_0174697824 /NCGR_PEP_ID=MMETSP1094-20130205/3578_1 /TAXON_ID=156173 /ORGANISM="Chrysochromulina brevifilum, Strain UTEX LB 985" /LENGTH=51 /DNA_ID=CAMNT_0015894883 /DNA_START=751 /DNA_END=906 /DNA_ORIENTATION=+